MFIKNTGLFILIGSLVCSSAYSVPNNNLPTRPDIRPDSAHPSIPNHPALEKMSDKYGVAPVRLDRAKELGFTIEKDSNGNSLLTSPSKLTKIVVGPNDKIKLIETKIEGSTIQITPSDVANAYHAHIMDDNGAILTSQLAPNASGDIVVTPSPESGLPTQTAHVDTNNQTVTLSSVTGSRVFSYAGMQSDIGVPLIQVLGDVMVHIILVGEAIGILIRYYPN
jgi:hypothetical protein